MFVLMMIVAGMAIALAIYFLLAAVFRSEPEMRAETVQQFGILPSVLIFALCGPILVLKLQFKSTGLDDDDGDLLGLAQAGFVALFWSGTLGIAATFSAAAVFAPTFRLI